MSNSNSTYKPHGERLNNPGNIRCNPHFKWLGQTGSDHRGFCMFTQAVYGLRAIFITLRNYRAYHDLNTVHGIIARWAPPSDHNATEAYVKFVANRCQIEPLLPLGDYWPLRTMVKAIVEYENGYDPYDDDEYIKAQALSEHH